MYLLTCVFLARLPKGVARLLLVIASALAVSTCGFQPRGSVLQLTDMGSIYVDTERSLSISDAVRSALAEAAFTLAPNRDVADTLLRLGDEFEDVRVVSIRSDGRINELELSHRVSMLIAESIDGEPPFYEPAQAANQVEVRREYTYDENGVLGKENEAKILRDEIFEELVRQIVLRTIATLSRSVS